MPLRPRGLILGKLAAALTLASSAALAQAPAAPPTPDWTVTANVLLGSEYIFRGIAQTAGKPTVQGGFDVAHSGGFYAGTWASNISWLEDFGAYNRSSLEWDFYGGFKKNFGDSDWFWDVGTLYYYYPGSKNPGVISADTWEIYAALGWKWASVKFSYNVDDYFGLRPNGQKTDGTYYIDAVGDLPGRRDRLRAARPLRLPRRQARPLRRREAVVLRLEARRVVHGARRRAEGPRGRRVLHRQRREVGALHRPHRLRHVQGSRRRLREEDVLTRLPTCARRCAARRSRRR